MTPEQQIEFQEGRIFALRKLNENYLNTISTQHQLIQSQGALIVRLANEKMSDA